MLRVPQKPRRPPPDCYTYIRKTYGVPAYIGVRVRLIEGTNAREGVLVAARSDLHWLHVWLDGLGHPVTVHPTEVVYLVTNPLASRTTQEG